MTAFGIAIKMKEQKCDLQKLINTIKMEAIQINMNLEDTEVLISFLTIFKPEIHLISVVLPHNLSADRLSKLLDSFKKFNKKV